MGDELWEGDVVSNECVLQGWFVVWYSSWHSPTQYITIQYNRFYPVTYHRQSML